MKKEVSVYPIRVELWCDNCSDTEMKNTGITLTSHPIQYLHRCPNCKAEVFSKLQYPFIKFEDLPLPVTIPTVEENHEKDQRPA